MWDKHSPFGILRALKTGNCVERSAAFQFQIIEIRYQLGPTQAFQTENDQYFDILLCNTSLFSKMAF